MKSPIGNNPEKIAAITSMYTAGSPIKTMAKTFNTSYKTMKEFVHSLPVDHEGIKLAQKIEAHKKSGAKQSARLQMAREKEIIDFPVEMKAHIIGLYTIEGLPVSKIAEKYGYSLKQINIAMLGTDGSKGAAARNEHKQAARIATTNERYGVDHHKHIHTLQQ